MYSSAKLTVFTDKMIAIASPAMELRQRLDDVYLAGMWKKDLVRQLYWRTFSSRSKAKYSRADTYFAPTWSWASTIEADSNATGRLSGIHAAVFLAKVLSAAVTSRHPSGLHSFSFGGIQI